MLPTQMIFFSFVQVTDTNDFQGAAPAEKQPERTDVCKQISDESILLGKMVRGFFLFLL